jgi:hypothetical protein
MIKRSPIIVRRPVVVVLGEELEMKEKNGFSGPSTLPSNKE